jgi:hypothetical protein
MMGGLERFSRPGRATFGRGAPAGEHQRMQAGRTCAMALAGMLAAGLSASAFTSGELPRSSGGWASGRNPTPVPSFLTLRQVP